MSNNKKTFTEYKEKIVDNIKEDLEKGKNVVYVTLGDPMLYSTYVYILEGLKNVIDNLEFETVPGITSFSAMAAKSGVPLVEENEVLTIYPATHFSEKTFEALYETSNSMVVMKIPKKSSEITELIKENKFSKIIHMKNICLPEEELHYNIEGKELSDDNVKKYLSIILLKK